MTRAAVAALKVRRAGGPRSPRHRLQVSGNEGFPMVVLVPRVLRGWSVCRLLRAGPCSR